MMAMSLSLGYVFCNPPIIILCLLSPIEKINQSFQGQNKNKNSLSRIICSTCETLGNSIIFGSISIFFLLEEWSNIYLFKFWELFFICYLNLKNRRKESIIPTTWLTKNKMTSDLFPCTDAFWCWITCLTKTMDEPVRLTEIFYSQHDVIPSSNIHIQYPQRDSGWLPCTVDKSRWRREKVQVTWNGFRADKREWRTLAWGNNHQWS